MLKPLPFIALMTIGAAGASAERSKVLKVKLQLESRYVENAGRASRASDQIDELQHQGTLAASGSFTGDLISALNLDYQLSQVQYLEDSQADDTVFVGKSALDLGGRKDRFQFRANHSARQILLAPTARNISSNRDERNIIELEGIARTRPDLANSLSLHLQSTHTRLEQSALNNSHREGFELVFLRRSTPSIDIGAANKFSRVEFTMRDDANYDLQKSRAFAKYLAKGLESELSLGTVTTMQESGDSDRAGFASFSLALDRSHTRWLVNFSRDITDTSLGASNSRLFPGIGQVNVDARLDELDRFERTSFELGLTKYTLCSACELSLIVGQERDEFFELPNLNSTHSFMSVHTTYRVTARARLTSSINVSDVDFVEESAEIDHLRTYANIRFVTDLWVPGLTASVFVETEARSTQGTENYSTHGAGLSVSYPLW